MKNKQNRRVIMILFSVIFLIGAGIMIWSYALLPKDANQALEKIIKKNPQAVISVGILDHGKEETYIYTANGREDYQPYTYQIGSITKTFTGAMTAYEQAKGNLKLTDGNPSLEKLVTHTSGLSDEWEQEIAKNPNFTFSRQELYDYVDALTLTESSFQYSNIGSGLAGARVAEIYGKDTGENFCSYQEAMNHFLTNELGLTETTVGGVGDFKDNWIWQDDDEMMADGAMTSNVTDLLKYGQLYLNNDSRYDYLQNAVTRLADVNDSYGIGMFWILDDNNDMIWHNGEINMESEDGSEVGLQCFIGISPGRQRVVVVLSNVICNLHEDTAYTDMLGYMLMDE